MSSTSGRRFTVACTVSGKPVRLLVDTGANFTTFAPDIVPLSIIHARDSGGGMSHINSYAATSSMIGGDYTLYPAEVDHWKIGNYEMEHSYIATHHFPPHSLDDESAGDGPMLGLLGAEIMAANNAIIDIAGSTLYLKPGPQQTANKRAVPMVKRIR